MNPIEKIIEEKGLTVKDIAIFTGESLSHISHIRHGYYKKLPNNIIAKLQRFGYSKKELENSYKMDRNQKAEKILANAMR